MLASFLLFFWGAILTIGDGRLVVALDAKVLRKDLKKFVGFGVFGYLASGCCGGAGPWSQQPMSAQPSLVASPKLPRFRRNPHPEHRTVALKSKWWVNQKEAVVIFLARLIFPPTTTPNLRTDHRQSDKMARRPARCYRYCKNKVSLHNLLVGDDYWDLLASSCEIASTMTKLLKCHFVGMLSPLALLTMMDNLTDTLFL